MGEKKVKFVPIFNLIDEAKKKLDRFKYKILVISGKGGVGKSFVSSMLALGLAMRGKRVSIFDADIHGSSIPLFLGVQGSRHYANESGEILPVEGPLGVKVVAVNLMLDSPDTPLAWRGPLVGRAILELAAKVAWNEGDYLVVDMPPGTGDVAITVSQVFPSITGAILVTSPNALAETIVAKAANFMASTRIRLLGVIENMSYFRCPHCGVITNVMGEWTSNYFSERHGVVLLGKIPIDPNINKALNKGEPYLLSNREGDAARAILEVVDKIINLVENTSNR